MKDELPKDLNEDDIDKMLENCPPRRTITQFDYLYELWGYHEPSLTSVIPDILFERQLFKENNGSRVRVICLHLDEAKYAVKKINDTLGMYGYKAERKDTQLIVYLPWHSTSQILATEKLRSLCGTVIDGEEHILFVADKIFNLDSLKDSFKVVEQRFIKQFQHAWKYPENIKMIRRDAYIPELVGNVEWSYLQFLLSRTLSPEQVKTCDSLYLIAPVHDLFSIPMGSLIRLIAKHSGQSVKTVRNHLDQNHGFHFELLENGIIQRLTREQRMRIIIPKELDERLSTFVSTLNSPFSNKTGAIEHSLQQFLLESRMMVDLQEPRIAQDMGGIVMHDPRLNKEVMVRLNDNGLLFCTYHQFRDTCCSHTLKAELSRAMGELQKKKGLSTQINVPNVGKDKSSNRVKVHLIDASLYKKYMNWLDHKGTHYGFNTVSEVVEHALVLTLHKELGAAI